MSPRTRTRPEDVRRAVTACLESGRAAGFSPTGEALSVVAASGTFAGWDYRITREQLPGLVDCSSLVSQAHWLGAAIGMPFIAETQRIAYSGTDVAAGDLRPGDVLVRYPSRAASPGGRHNHVVLHLGEHPELGPSVIESAPEVGVRVRPLNGFHGLGGVRRFVLSDAPDFPRQQIATQLAAAVPKLGRLGSRLTAGLDEPRRHRGVDVLLRAASEVRAPIDGTATYLPNAPRGHDGAVAIRSEDGAVSVVLAMSGGPMSSRRCEQATRSGTRSNVGPTAVTPGRGTRGSHDFTSSSGRPVRFHTSANVG